MASVKKKHENCIELFLSTAPNKLNYVGPCAVDIKVLSKLFVVEPYDKKADTIEISVYSSFIQHENILYNISPESSVVLLIFPSIDACKTVNDMIFKYQANVKNEIVADSSLTQQLQDQIFINLMKEAHSNLSLSKRTKENILNMLQNNVATTEEENYQNSKIKSELTEHFHDPFTTFEPSISEMPTFNGNYPLNVDSDRNIESELPIDDLHSSGSSTSDGETYVEWETTQQNIRVPEQSAAEWDKDKCNNSNRLRRGPKSQDKDLVKKHEIPATTEEIVAMSHRDLRNFLKDHELSDTQKNLIKRIRRRGRNKEAARKCRELRKVPLTSTLPIPYPPKVSTSIKKAIPWPFIVYPPTHNPNVVQRNNMEKLYKLS